MLVVDEADLVLLRGGAHRAESLEDGAGRRLGLVVPAPLEEVVLLGVRVLRPLLQPLLWGRNRNALDQH